MEDDTTLPTAALRDFSPLNVCFGSSTAEGIDVTPRRLSALHPKADIRDLSRHVGFVPRADSCIAANIHSITPSAVESSPAPPLPVMTSIVSLFVRSNLNNAPYLCACSWRLAWRLVLAARCRPAARRWARRFYADANRSR